MIGAVLLAIPTPAQIAAAPAVSVPELINHHAELDGKIVRVRGWMGPCNKMGCFLFSRPGVKLNPGLPERHQWLSIAGNLAFDRQVQSLRDRRVTIAGRYDDSCLRGDICLDRSPELDPLAVAIDGDPFKPVAQSKEP